MSTLRPFMLVVPGPRLLSSWGQRDAAWPAPEVSAHSHDLSRYVDRSP